MIAQIYQLRLILTGVVPLHVWAVNTKALADHVCNGHLNPDGSQGLLGSESPKASVELPGDRYYLLCKACWQKQNLVLEEQRPYDNS